MNGSIIGGRNRLNALYRNGVWTPNSPELDWVGIPYPTSGLIHFWPLTSDANDTVGSLNLTNNNGVTFSADGAHFVSTSSQYLSATVTWPSEYTFVLETKLGSGLGLVYGSRSGTDYCMSTKVNFSTYPQLYFQGQILVGSSRYSTQISKNLGGLIDERYHRIVQVRRVCPSDGSDAAGKYEYSIYVDSMMFSIHVSASPVTISTSFAIGRIGTYDGEYQTGYCRNFRVYNRVLEPLEIMRVLAA